MGKQLV